MYTWRPWLPRHINSSRHQFDSTGHHQQHLRGLPCPLRNASFDPFNDVTRDISRPGLFSVSVAAFCPSPSVRQRGGIQRVSSSSKVILRPSCANCLRMARRRSCRMSSLPLAQIARARPTEGWDGREDEQHALLSQLEVRTHIFITKFTAGDKATGLNL